MAYGQIHAVPFRRWDAWAVTVPGSIYVNSKYKNGGAAGRALTAAAGSNGIAWAFYFTAPDPLIEKKVPSAWVDVSYGVTVDGGGYSITPGGKKKPVPPWDPNGPGLSVEFATGLMLAAVAGRVRPELRAGTLELAARQLSLAADTVAGDRVSGRGFRALAALGSVASASLGAATLYLAQAAAPDARTWIVILGTSAAALLGYLLPAAFSKSFTRS